MKSSVRILAHDDTADQLAYPIALMASYGIAATVHSADAAFAADLPDTVWLTLERRCVPTLALLASGWSTDIIGGLGNIAGPAMIRDVLAEVGLRTSVKAAQGSIEGYVWNGAFRASAIAGAPTDGAALIDGAQRACTELGVVRSYLRIDFDNIDAIVDLSPIPGDTAMIRRARLAGFCPLWTACCIATNAEPLMPLLDVGRVRDRILS
jgi:hypothetical protein